MNSSTHSKDAVFNVYKDHYTRDFLFHNFAYVSRVDEALEILLAKVTGLSDKSTEEIKVALWFHASGFYKDFELGGTTGISLAEDYMKSLHWETSRIQRVIDFINVTSGETKPELLEEQLLFDVAHYHLATSDFMELQKLWREELKLTKQTDYNDTEWYYYLSGVLRDFSFKTPQAREVWENGVNSNYLKIRKQAAKGDKISKKEQKNIDKQVEKGRDTVFRIATRNHMALSENADRKAHILLSVNSIIISLLLSRLFPKLDSSGNAYLYTPTIVFMAFTVVSIILSVIATRPRITSGRFSKEELLSKKVNILFFGNFFRMKLKDYEDAMEVVLNDSDRIYNSLTKDLYYLGKVVARKYRILQWAYGIFMVGIVVSSLLYIIYFNRYN